MHDIYFKDKSLLHINLAGFILMLDTSKLKENLFDKIKNHTHLKKEIEIIVENINNELYKFEYNNTSAHLNYASLFVYRPGINGQNDIELAISKINSIRENEQVNLSTDICDYIYDRLSKIDPSHLTPICKEQTEEFIYLINNRKLPNVTENMRLLLDKLPASANKSYRQILQLILQIDPVYQVLKDNDKYKNFFPTVMHYDYQEVQENNLSLELLKPLINLLVKIHRSLFKTHSDNDDNDDDQPNSSINKRM